MKLMMDIRLKLALSALLLTPASCSAAPVGDKPALAEAGIAASEEGRFDEPWAMAFLPGGKAALITERRGRLKLWREGAPSLDVAGVPPVDYGGQGGLGDVQLAPDFATSGTVYLTWVEAGPRDTRGAVLGRGHLTLGDQPRLEDFAVIWRQQPKVTGRGHFSHRIAFSPDGKYLFLTSGERQKFAPAQDLSNDLGKVLRLNLDGTPAAGNPFADRGGLAREIWSYGHRNLLGIKFDAAGRLWELEHGPAGGDELNLIEPGRNYGWPLVSNGDNYDGTPIPRHATRPDLAAPAISWNPVIGPGDFIIYRGALFPGWNGEAVIAGLVSRGLVRVALDRGTAREVQRIDFGTRLREVVEREDGTIWVLTDGRGGRLLKLTPAR